MIVRIAFIAFLVLISCDSNDKRAQKSQIQVISEKIAENPTDINLLYSRVNYCLLYTSPSPRDRG